VEAIAAATTKRICVAVGIVILARHASRIFIGSQADKSRNVEDDLWGGPLEKFDLRHEA